MKMAMGMLESGMKNTEIARYMKDQYLVSPEKTALAVTIANRERDILKNIDYENGYSLYVGIPFCPSICLYCSFSSYPLERWRKYVEAYLDALVKEIRAVSGMMKTGSWIRSISAEEHLPRWSRISFGDFLARSQNIFPVRSWKNLRLRQEDRTV